MRATVASVANLLYDHAFPVYRWFYGPWKRLTEREDTRLFRRLVTPGDMVIDVGANIGHYASQFASLVGPRGRVLAIEPDPRNAARLRLRLARRPQARVHQVAAGEAPGDIRLYLSRNNSADHRTFDSGDGRPSIRVACVRLDDMVPPGCRVQLIKIDVQGHELAVLRGARRVIEESPNIRVVMEYWPHGLRKAGCEPEKLLRCIEECGLTAMDMRGRPFVPTRPETDHPDAYMNLLLAKPVKVP